MRRYNSVVAVTLIFVGLLSPSSALSGDDEKFAPGEDARTQLPLEEKRRDSRPTAEEALLADFARSVSRGAAAQITYPKEPLAKEIQGDVLVHVTYGINGKVLSARVAKSSGNADLDSAAVEGVQRAAGASPLPKVLAGHQVNISVPVTFQISAAGAAHGNDPSHYSLKTWGDLELSADAMERFVRQLRDAIPRVRSPDASSLNNAEQHVDLVVAFGSSGELSKVKVDQTSGDKRFDAAAVDAIKIAAKKVTVPESLRFDPPSFKVRIYAAQPDSNSQR